MKEITVCCAGIEYLTKSFTFPGGEIQVQVPGIPSSLEGDLIVTARLQSSESLIQLCLLTEIIERVHNGKRALFIPYFPYARQDRVMAPQEAFSLKVVARLINGLGYDRVITCDPHSDVTPALVEKLCVVPQLKLVRSHAGLQPHFYGKFLTVVAPDAGAAKKAFSVAQHFSLPLVTASKTREVASGAITHTEIQNHSQVKGLDALIVDDICDGGRTFIELAKALRAQGASRVYLYVTHGIFSQGFGVFDGLIDAIFTTDSFESPLIREDSPVPLHISSLNLIANGVAA